MTDPDDQPPGPDSSDAGRASGGVHSVRHDLSTSDPLHLTIVSSVAAVTNTEPESLPPLYDAVDPDSLERLLRSVPDENRSNVSIAFPFAGLHVEVAGNGEVTLDTGSNAVADD